MIYLLSQYRKYKGEFEVRTHNTSNGSFLGVTWMSNDFFRKSYPSVSQREIKQIELDLLNLRKELKSTKLKYIELDFYGVDHYDGASFEVPRFILDKGKRAVSTINVDHYDIPKGWEISIGLRFEHLSRSTPMKKALEIIFANYSKELEESALKQLKESFTPSKKTMEAMAKIS